MHSFVSNLTATMLLIHALFGCCRHHEHACCDQPVECHATAACCCHDHDCHDRDRELPQPPAPCKELCKGVCTYLPPQKVLVHAPQLVTSIDLPPDVSNACVCPATASCFRDGGWLVHAPRPPIRLHLVHQIILV